MSYINTMTKALNTLVEMLEYRHDYDNSKFVQSFINENLSDFLSRKTIFHVDHDDKLRLIFHTGTKFKGSDVKKLFEEQDFKLFILIIQEQATNINMKGIEELKLNIQVFDVKELQFNITKHSLVPKHEIVREERIVDEILVKFKIKQKIQLPIILRTDAMARFMNAQSGDLVKITRYSPSSGENIIYRYYQRCIYDNNKILYMTDMNTI